MNRPARRFVLRSVAATTTGWSVPPAILYVFPMNGSVVSGPTGSHVMDTVITHVVGFLWFSYMMGFWVVPTWLLAVLPLSLFVSERSKFWHPLIIGPVGTVAGGAVFFGSVAFITGRPGDLQVWGLMPVAGIACAVGLVTALMLAYLFQRRGPIQPPETTRGGGP